MSSPDHSHESTGSGNKPGCMKIIAMVSGAIFLLTVVPMETRGYVEEQSHLPSWSRDKGLVWNALGVAKYMGRDIKSIASKILGTAKDTVDEL
ncbi:hypothetical protein KA057_03780 [Candidatus Gracilibacteria bacterium]|nr:hypothetical protein [Candidatus Gracilibacteria bacterium]